MQESVANKTHPDKNNDLEKALKPLGIFWKILAFILPFIVAIGFYSLRSNGYYRQALELKSWTLYGFLFYTVLVVLAQLLAM